MRSSRMTRVLLLVATGVACGGADATDSTSESTDRASYDSSTPVMEECPPPGPSSCGDESSVIRARITLPPDASGSEGTLFVGLTHQALGGGADGGSYHWHEEIPNVDWSSGSTLVELDMCDGGQMWTEDNCEFVFFAFLDVNGNANAGSFLPDAGEPSGRIMDLALDCYAGSPCLELELDCEAGAPCLAFDDPSPCSCSTEDSCDSDIVTCR